MAVYDPWERKFGYEYESLGVGKRGKAATVSPQIHDSITAGKGKNLNLISPKGGG